MERNKNTLWSLIAVSMLLFVISSCRHDPAVPETPICFDSDVYPIIASNCDQSNCHASGELSLISYEKIVNSGTVTAGKPRQSSLYKKIISECSPMPPKPHSRLTNDQIRNIYIWILQGAKHTTCSDSIPLETCDSINVTYSGTIKPIIDAYCKSCHSGSNPPGGQFLETYSQLVEIGNEGFLQQSVINYGGDNPMPPAGPLNACQIAQLKKWLSDGMPNN
jgi:hypothetical protein